MVVRRLEGRFPRGPGRLASQPLDELLVERAQLNLSDPVQRYLPEFTGQGKEAVQVLHFFTHTSGLPDELPLTM